MKSRKALLACVVSCTALAGCNDDSSGNGSQNSSGDGVQKSSSSGPKISQGTFAAPAAPAPPPAPPCVSNIPAAGWISPAGLKYQVSAVDNQIIRIRVGKSALPEDASWAVLQAARTPLACATTTDNAVGSDHALTTGALKVAVDGFSGIVTISDNSGNVLSKDAGAPVFNSDGSFSFASVIPANSAFFGLGDRYPNSTTNGPIPVNRAGGAFLNWAAEPGQNGNYRDIPFYIRRTGDAYAGYFLDNTWRQTYDFGKATPGALAVTANGGGIDYYVIAGSSPKEVLANYAKLTGATPLQALWAYGWQQSKYGYSSAQWISDNVVTGNSSSAGGYRKLNIPADVIWLDIQYQYNNRPFTVDTGGSYSGLDGFIKNWSDQKFKTVLIADLHIAATDDPTGAAATSSIPAAAPAGLSAYSSGYGKGYFITNPGGGDFQDAVWPAWSGASVLSVYPDFTYKPARDWWGTLYKPFYTTFNVAGFWDDMNEPVDFNGPSGVVPLNVVDRIQEPGFQSRSTTQQEVHDIFGMQNSRGTHDGLLAINPDQRPFVMTRASYAGGHRYAVTWTGDNHSTWPDLRIATDNITDLGLGGFSAGADIGGFGGGPTSDLLTRWIEIGSFYPIARDHSSNGAPLQAPWDIVNAGNVGGPIDDLAARTKYIRNRYALMPYIYTLAEEASRTGAPMMRRMFLEFPTATAPGSSPAVPIDIAAETQFMVGPSLLVAPSPIEQGFTAAPPPDVPFGDVVEGENTLLAGGAEINNNHNGASGGNFVDGVNRVGAQMSINLTNVPSDGTYSFQVRYANGQWINGLSTRTLSVLVDGVSGGQVNFPLVQDYNWDKWATASLSIPLTAGSHLISLAYAANDSGNVNIDDFGVTQTNALYPTTFASVATPSTLPYDVMLPPGPWYDYWTGKLIPAPSTGTASSWTYNIANPTIADIPVFVRAGSIIPRTPQAVLTSIQSTADVAKISTLELSVYPGANCSGSLYVDDGSSMAYKNGTYYRRAFTCAVSGNQVAVNFGAVMGSFAPSWKSVTVNVYGGKGSPVSQTIAEASAASTITLSVP
jgi:alpha-glucosidase (family GH31 glycosyl hydrolase)